MFFSISKNSAVLFLYSVDHKNLKGVRQFMLLYRTGSWMSASLLFIGEHTTGEAMVFYDIYPFLSVFVQAEKLERISRS